MEKLCLCCGTKFSGNIDLLSGDFAATYFSIHKLLFVVRILFNSN